MAAKDDQQPLHILFFPFLAAGHLIPIADMAALFAARGVKCTILTTPANANIISSAVDRANDALRGVGTTLVALSFVPFPNVGLPPGVENGADISSNADIVKLFQGAELLREPVSRFLAEHRPDALVADSFFAWAVDAAAEHNIPRLVFSGCSLFARSCMNTTLRKNLIEDSTDDPDATVFLPGLPNHVELRRSQMMDPKKRPDQWTRFQRVNASDEKSYGEVVNSFHELEPEYVKHYHTVLGRRAWLVGPVELVSKDRAERGTTKLSADADGCLRWLDEQPAGSVVYVSFGTLSKFAPAQLRELARGLELSGKHFIWVVNGADTDTSECLPEGFAEQVARDARSIIFRGWAPQMLILSHPAVGGFVTHCGWNSSLEAVSAGVPMATWPLYADQFYNEKLIVELLGVGVSVGSMEYASKLETRRVVAGEVVGEAIGRVMGDGEEAEALRRRVKELREKARSAVVEGGSSHADVGRLIDELMARRGSV